MLKEYEEFNVGIPHKQIINFDIFKKIDNFLPNAFLTCVSKGLPSKEIIEEILDLVQDSKILYISVKYEDFDELYHLTKEYKKIVLWKEHPKNFHSFFDTYVYYHMGYFDPHPRLFHECSFYNKKIIYINKQNIKDGGFFRYKDSLKRDFNV